MKNKKGFTLVELMSVIVVLAIIIAIAVPVYNKIQKNINEKNYENKIELIEVAASKYAEDTHYETMYVDALIKNGYLDADNDKGEIFNNVTGDIINCYIVQATLENGTYYAKLIETKETYNNGCSLNIPNDYNKILTIKMINATTNEEIEKENSYNWWTNSNVKLKADVKLSENQGIEKIEWYEGSFSEKPIPLTDDKFKITENNDSDKKEYLLVSADSVLQQNYIARVTLSDGKIYNSVVRVYIDKIAPKFYDNDGKNLNDKWTTELKYNIKAYDNESGIYGFCIKEDGIECKEKKDFKTKLDTLKENGIYEVYIMDNVGNISNKTQDISKIDNTAPTCGDWFGESEVWSNSNRTIGVKCDDIGSGCKSNEYKQTFNSGSTSTKTVTFIIEDEVGNKTECTKNVNVYIDKDKPKCTSSGGSSLWTNDSRTLLGTCKDTNGSGCVDGSIAGRTYANGNVSWLINWDGEWTNLSPGTVYDKAGNSTTCPSDQTVKIDKIAPTFPTVSFYKWNSNDTKPESTSGLSSYSVGTWTNKKIYTVASGSTDAGVGGVYYQYTTTGKTTNATDSTSSTRNIEANGNSTIKYRACDALGNCSAYTSVYNVYVDKAKPSCTISSTLSTDKKTSDLVINATDAHSGLATNAYSWDNSTYKKSNTKTAKKNKTYTAYVKDAVGNVGSCSVNVSNIVEGTDLDISSGRTDWNNSLAVGSAVALWTSDVPSSGNFTKLTYQIAIEEAWFHQFETLRCGFTVADSTPVDTICDFRNNITQCWTYPYNNIIEVNKEKYGNDVGKTGFTVYDSDSSNFKSIYTGSINITTNKTTNYSGKEVTAKINDKFIRLQCTPNANPGSSHGYLIIDKDNSYITIE